MKPQIVWKGLAWMLVRGIGIGILNILFYILVINPNNAGTKPDEVAINTYVLNLFVGWMLFTAWFLAKTDEEWKKCAEAVAKNDREMFLLEAPKRIALSIRVLYIIISVMTAVSFHMFHIESLLATFEIQFGVGFFVAMAIMVLWDLDDPITGVINISNIPEDWLQDEEI